MISPSDRPLGPKIRPTLAAANRHASQRVLERFLEAQELHDPDIHQRTKLLAPLVGAKGRVELHLKAAVDLHSTHVVHSMNSADDLAFGFTGLFDWRGVEITWMLGHYTAKAFEHLMHGLMEFRHAGIAAGDLAEDGLMPFVDAVRAFAISRDGPALCPNLGQPVKISSS